MRFFSEKTAKSEPKEKKDKKITLADMERTVMLEKEPLHLKFKVYIQMNCTDNSNTDLIDIIPGSSQLRGSTAVLTNIKKEFYEGKLHTYLLHTTLCTPTKQT